MGTQVGAELPRLLPDLHIFTLSQFHCVGEL